MAGALLAWPRLQTLILRNSDGLGLAGMDAVVAHAPPALRHLDLSNCRACVSDRCPALLLPLALAHVPCPCTRASKRAHMHAAAAISS